MNSVFNILKSSDMTHLFIFDHIKKKGEKRIFFFLLSYAQMKLP